MNNDRITLNPDQQLFIMNVFIGILVLLIGVFAFLSIAGFGTLDLNKLPKDASVRINGHSATGRSVRLRPGSYDVMVSSPYITPYQTSLDIPLLGTVTFNPTLQPRSPSAIFSSLFGAALSTSIPPDPANVEWLDDNTWLVASLNPGGVVAAAHFDSVTKQWIIGYCSNGQTYPHDATKLPADVKNYVGQLEAQHAQGF